MTGRLRIVAVNAVLLVFGLGLVELAAGSWFDAGALGDLDIPAYREQSVDVSGLYPGGGVVRWRRDRYGLRGRYPSPGRIDILAVGGSTTAESLINDGETWTDTLARTLSAPGRPVHVANAGLDGHSTFGHAKALRQWFPRIPGLKPRLVLFHVGINDAVLADAAPNHYDSFEPRTMAQRLRNRLYNDSALYHLYRRARGLYRAYVSDVVHRPGDQDFADLGDGTLVPAPPGTTDAEPERPSAALDRYRRRLMRLAGAAAAMGARPVFVNQAWRGVFPRADGIHVRRHHVDSAGTHYARFRRSLFYAEATMQACREVARAVCVDLAGRLRLEPGDFYDFIHATPAGAAKIGAFLARALRPHIN